MQLKIKIILDEPLELPVAYHPSFINLWEIQNFMMVAIRTIIGFLRCSHLGHLRVKAGLKMEG